MIKFLAGMAFGIFVATVGVSGLVNVADKGVQKVQDLSREVTK
jgi:hypothetical protein